MKRCEDCGQPCSPDSVWCRECWKKDGRRVRPGRKKKEPPPIPVVDLTNREFDILCHCADTPGFHPIEQLADLILAGCPGPRTARNYAAECVFNLIALGLMTEHGRRQCFYGITDLGRRFLESPVLAAGGEDG